MPTVIVQREPDGTLNYLSDNHQFTPVLSIAMTFWRDAEHFGDEEHTFAAAEELAEEHNARTMEVSTTALDGSFFPLTGNLYGNIDLTKFD